MKLEFIRQHEVEFEIMRMCHILEVKKSTYYAWKKKPMSRRGKENIILLEKIKEFFENSKKTYGSPRILVKLKSAGLCCGHNRLARLMRVNSIVSKIKKRTYRNFAGYVDKNKACPNILDRNFSPVKPNQVWVTDITYINSESGWLYLCVFLDLFSRKIVGWAVANNMETDLVINALKKACENRKPEKGLIIHSDQGSQYGSATYRAFLERHKFVQSMSRRGNCWDNACAETFFKTLKIEELDDLKFQDVDSLKWVLFKYIDVFYNRARIHSTLGYLNPEDFEKKLVA